MSERISRALDAAAEVNSEIARLPLSATDALTASVSDALAQFGVTENAALEQAREQVPELRQLSDEALKDLRLALILEKPDRDHDAWIAALAWQSSEAVGRRLTVATWGLVAATAALVVATVVLIFVTALHAT